MQGSAFLWTRPSLQDIVVPPVVSGAYASGDYIETFQYTGTRDYNAMLSIADAFAFRYLAFLLTGVLNGADLFYGRNKYGETSILQYIHNLAWSAAQQIAAIWNTTLLVPYEHMNGAMVVITLPSNNGAISQCDPLAPMSLADEFQ